MGLRYGGCLCQPVEEGESAIKGLDGEGALLAVLVPTAHSTAQRSWFESKSTSKATAT